MEENEAAFWDEFRERYEPFAAIDGSDADDFLTALGDTPHTPGVYYDLDTLPDEEARRIEPGATPHRSGNAPQRPDVHDQPQPEPGAHQKMTSFFLRAWRGR
ncbi:hypothetical protein [Rhodococcus marinonascens]|uniref:hypothetical protein n=1 Tax=Rhodococcus marinonascens TaxID=38311 RepID=UPI0009350658|nr:hypothetical protein [Rhodococcus marinonascens]